MRCLPFTPEYPINAAASSLSLPLHAMVLSSTKAEREVDVFLKDGHHAPNGVRVRWVDIFLCKKFSLHFLFTFLCGYKIATVIFHSWDSNVIGNLLFLFIVNHARNRHSHRYLYQYHRRLVNILFI